MIRRFFQQDNMLLGIGVGIVVPALVYGLFILIVNLFSGSAPNAAPLVKTSTIQLVAIFTNLFTLRYYLLRLKFDYTGRGILLVTMILAIIYFALHL